MAPRPGFDDDKFKGENASCVNGAWSTQQRAKEQERNRTNGLKLPKHTHAHTLIIPWKNRGGSEDANDDTLRPPACMFTSHGALALHESATDEGHNALQDQQLYQSDRRSWEGKEGIRCFQKTSAKGATE